MKHPARTHISRPALVAGIVVGIAFLAGVDLFTVGLVMSTDGSDVSPDVARAGIQLAVVAVLGGLVAFVLRYGIQSESRRTSGQTSGWKFWASLVRPTTRSRAFVERCEPSASLATPEPRSLLSKRRNS